MKTFARSIAAFAAVTVLVLAVRDAKASGFAIKENSTEALGTAFAGAASSGTFLSTIFNNPAGMTQFAGERAQLDASLIFPSVRFSGTATANCPACGAGGTPITGSGSGNAGQAAFVPAGYVLDSLSPDLKVGVAMTAPFGLSTIYPSDWVGRYFGIKSEIKTLDFNPNLAYRVNNWLSIGGGFSVQYLSAELTNAINSSGFAGFPPNTALPDGSVRVHGDDWALGYNAGVLLQPQPGTNVGLTYRSRVEHKVSGDVTFNVPGPLSANPNFASSRATAAITVPDSVDLSVTQKVTDKLNIQADLSWTDWSVFKNLTIVRSTNGSIVGGAPTPENFKNTWFVAIGGTYSLDDHWTLRTGVAYDQTPVSDRFRSVRLPDSDRFWLAFGAEYKFYDGFSIDFGAAHIFMPNAGIASSVNSTQTLIPGVSSNTITGKYANQIDLVSLQTRFRF